MRGKVEAGPLALGIAKLGLEGCGVRDTLHRLPEDSAVACLAGFIHLINQLVAQIVRRVARLAIKGAGYV